MRCFVTMSTQRICSKNYVILHYTFLQTNNNVLRSVFKFNKEYYFSAKHFDW
jgi:hypothetical protein